MPDFSVVFILLIIGLPLLSSVFSLVGNMYKYSAWLIGITFILSFTLLMRYQNPMGYSLPWIVSGNISIPFEYLVDSTGALMLMVVTLISTIVHIYSLEYMHNDTEIRRYYAYLGVFTSAMLGLVIAANFFLLFICWELMGIFSYLLIGFWHRKEAARKAAKKAFLINRIGDIGFLVAIFTFFTEFNTFSFTSVELINGNTASILFGIGILLAVCAKSAQGPFSIWLPDAMEGPTPVSALIHAATMVAAGIFLLSKTIVYIEIPIREIIVWTGAITSLLAALAALSQTDIKKLLAYSTISQLGFMMMAAGTGNTSVALFHLITHAFFKAALFLLAGNVIHALHSSTSDAQDMRTMGGLYKKMPVTFVLYIISGFSLAGLPFFSGFLSKEAIIGAAYHWDNSNAIAITTIAACISLLTAFYISRQIVLVFLGNYRGESAKPFEEIKEATKLQQSGLVVLGLFSLGICYSPNPFSVSSNIIMPFIGTIEYHLHLPMWLLFGIPLLSVTAILGAYLKYKNGISAASADMSFYEKVSYRYFYMNVVYEKLLVKPTLALSVRVAGFDKHVLDWCIDKFAVAHIIMAHSIAWIDTFLVDGFVKLMAALMAALGKRITALQKGKIQSYVMILLVSVVLLLLILLLIF